MLSSKFNKVNDIDETLTIQDVIISDDLTVKDTLTVSGATTLNTLTVSGNCNFSNVTCNTLTATSVTTSITTLLETLTVDDNMIICNNNLTGTPDPTLISGIEIERGNVTNYQFVFRESDDSFCIGEKTADPLNLQPVLTKNASMIANGILFYDAVNNRANTVSNVVLNSDNIDITDEGGITCSGGINCLSSSYKINNIEVITPSRFILPSHTTTQKNALTDLTAGSLVYDTTLNAINHYSGSAWLSHYPVVGVSHSTGTLTVGINTDTIYCRMTGNTTVNLPQISSYGGSTQKVIRVVRLTEYYGGSLFTLNINPFSGDTVNGASSIQLFNLNEAVTLVSDSVTNNWVIINLYQRMEQQTETMTITAITSNPSLGNTTINNLTWYRQGRYLIANYTLWVTTGGGAGSGNYLFRLPASLSTSIEAYDTSASGIPGVNSILCTSGLLYTASTPNTWASPCLATMYNSTAFRVLGISHPTGFNHVGSTFVKLGNNAQTIYQFTVKLRIDNWLGS